MEADQDEQARPNLRYRAAFHLKANKQLLDEVMKLEREMLVRVYALTSTLAEATRWTTALMALIGTLGLVPIVAKGGSVERQ